MKGLGTYNEAYEKKLQQETDDAFKNWQHFKKKSEQWKTAYELKVEEGQAYEVEVKLLMREL
jgi:hypothetical protein